MSNNTSNNSLVSEKCLGTCTVPVQQHNDGTNGTPAAGLMAAFLPSNGVELDVMVMVGTDAFQGRISKDNVKSSKSWLRNDSDSTTNVMEELGNAMVSCQETSSIISTFYTMSNSPSTSMQLAIKETVQSSGLVRVVWNGPLHKISSKDSWLQLPMRLGQCLKEQASVTKSLHDRIAKLEQDLKLAHETVQKLDMALQSEKDDLLERFLVLYNEMKEKHLDPAKRRIRELEKELKEAKAAKNETTHAKKPAFAAMTDQDTVMDQGYDTDEVLFDSDMVDRLAAGPSNNNKKRKVESTTTTTRNKDTSQNDGAVPITAAGATPTRTARRNPLNGAIEMWDAKGIFADQQDTANTKEPPAHSQPDTNSPVPERKPGPEKAARNHDPDSDDSDMSAF